MLSKHLETIHWAVLILMRKAWVFLADPELLNLIKYGPWPVKRVAYEWWKHGLSRCSLLAGNSAYIWSALGLTRNYKKRGKWDERHSDNKAIMPEIHYCPVPGGKFIFFLDMKLPTIGLVSILGKHNSNKTSQWIKRTMRLLPIVGYIAICIYWFIYVLKHTAMVWSVLLLFPFYEWETEAERWRCEGHIVNPWQRWISQIQ